MRCEHVLRWENLLRCENVLRWENVMTHETLLRYGSDCLGDTIKLCLNWIFDKIYGLEFLKEDL